VLAHGPTGPQDTAEKKNWRPPSICRMGAAGGSDRWCIDRGSLEAVAVPMRSHRHLDLDGHEAKFNRPTCSLNIAVEESYAHAKPEANTFMQCCR